MSCGHRTVWRGILAALLLSFSSAHAVEFEFGACNDSNSASDLRGSLCSTVAVPLRSKQRASGGTPETVYLFVRKFPAAHVSAGTVWLIAGGPGESGATFYPFIQTLRRAFSGFDLLIPDHRGTGYSTRLCPIEEAIGSLGGGLLVGSERSSCWQTLQSHPQYATSFSISNAARDLAYLISEYGGTRPIYLYGSSYGTQLILRTLQLGRLPIQAVIFDSLVPPESEPQWDLGHRTAIVDAAGLAFLRRCEVFASCRGHFSGSLVEGYSRMLKAVTPQVLDQVPGRDLRVFFGGLLNYPQLRTRIPQLIDELTRGETTELTATKRALDQEITALEQYPQSPLSLPLVSIISASENFVPAPSSGDGLPIDGPGPRFATSYPTLLVEPQLPLYGRDRYFGANPGSIPRTLVIQGTLDPKTPYAAALRHVGLLKKAGPISLVAAVDSPHFVLMSSPECVVAAITRFRSGPEFESPPECRKSLLASGR